MSRARTFLRNPSWPSGLECTQTQKGPRGKQGIAACETPQMQPLQSSNHVIASLFVFFYSIRVYVFINCMLCNTNSNTHFYAFSSCFRVPGKSSRRNRKKDVWQSASHIFSLWKLVVMPPQESQFMCIILLYL